MANEVEITLKIGGVDKMPNEINKATGILKKFVGDIGSSSGILKNVTIGTVLGNAIYSGFANSISAVKNEIIKLGSFAVDNIKSSINMAAHAQSTALSFEVLIGDAQKARDLMKQMSDFEIATPLDIGQIQELGISLLNVGTPLDQIMEDMQILGDVTAASPIPGALQRVSYAFTQVSSAGRLMGQDFKQFTEAGIPLGKMLEDVTGIAGINSGNVGDLGITFDQVREALKRSTQEGGRFNDMMVRQSHTLLGLTSSLSSVKDRFLSMVGGFDMSTGELTKGGLLDVLSTQAQTLLDQLTNNGGALSGLAGNISTTLGSIANDMLPKIIEKLPGAIEDASKFIKNIDPKEVIATMEDFGKVMEGIVTTVSKLPGAWNDAKEAYKGFTKDFQDVLDPLEKTGLDMSPQKLKELADGISEVGLKQDELSLITEEYRNHLIDTSGTGVVAVKRITDAIIEEGIKSGISTERLVQLKDAAYRLGNEGNHSISTVASGINSITNSSNNARGSIQSLTNDFWSLNWAIQNAAASARNLANSGAGSLLGKYAQGGIVPGFSEGGIPRAENGIIAGNDTSGDKRLIRVNSGEMIINKNDQGALFNFIKQLSSRPQQVINANFNSSNSRNDRQEMNLFNQMLATI